MYVKYEFQNDHHNYYHKIRNISFWKLFKFDTFLSMTYAFNFILWHISKYYAVTRINIRKKNENDEKRNIYW